jgi:hypothetical protein
MTSSELRETVKEPDKGDLVEPFLFHAWSRKIIEPQITLFLTTA